MGPDFRRRFRKIYPGLFWNMFKTGFSPPFPPNISRIFLEYGQNRIFAAVSVKSTGFLGICSKLDFRRRFCKISRIILVYVQNLYKSIIR